MAQSISYQAASSFPFKMVANQQLMAQVQAGKVIPYHVSISPTNLCNRKCHFCSCADRKVTDCLSLSDMTELFGILERCGTRAVTITGGGEPLLHRDINKILRSCPFEIGLVTNGDQLERLELSALNRLTWMRVSAGDQFNNLSLLKKVYDKAVRGGSPDWAISYVLSAGNQVNIENVKEHVRFVRDNNFTHIRIVTDINEAIRDPQAAQECVQNVRTALQNDDLVDSRVIFQSRAETCSGANPCLVSLMRPFITARGMVQPCCGIFYTYNVKDFPESANMGHFRDLPQIIEQQRFFDGSVCRTCYYGSYNTALQALTRPMEHGAFI